MGDFFTNIIKFKSYFVLSLFSEFLIIIKAGTQTDIFDTDTVNDTKSIITELTLFAKLFYERLGKFRFD